MTLQFGPRRAVILDAKEALASNKYKFSDEEIKAAEFLDLCYRTLCAIMFNYVPTSGHPGGSISSGRFVQSALFNTMAYDLSNPLAKGADVMSYGAGHKALGLYAMWALRNEVARIAAPDLLPKETKYQMRLEDILGFRRNPTQDTPLFKQFHAKPLDGHPTPQTPFLLLSTGASGVGVCASFGLAMGAIDMYGADNAPHIHVIEGEGGMTPGRVQEAFSFASTSGLKNLVMHIDWNQASIDSNHVCREGNVPGDYVQWDPIEFAYLNDWNVIRVSDGKDMREVFTAQKMLSEINNNQPTAIVYRTVKGWKYGIEGRASHGAGHGFCTDGYFKAIKEIEDATGVKLPRFDCTTQCATDPVLVEKYYYDTLMTIRKIMEMHSSEVKTLAGKLENAKKNLATSGRTPRKDAPNVAAVYDATKFAADKIPQEVALKPGSSTTLRAELGNVLGVYNKASNGAFLIAAADLLGSTSITNIAKGFAEGFYHSEKNPGSRTLSVGGICEDAIGGVMSGVASYGNHIGVGSSYAAFIAALQHITARLHGIGNQARHELTGEPYKPFIIICGHSGLKTGEDGPTHADPQALQLFQENFPAKIMVTMSPWDPQEIWPLMTAALQARPAVIAPFVTRPNEKVIDRAALGMPPATVAAKGAYAMRKADASKKCDGTIVLQESGITYIFVEEVLPRLIKEGLNLNIYYITSAELFDRLPKAEQEAIFPDAHRHEAMGITGHTMPTMFRWVTSEVGRNLSIHPYVKGHYLGSGQASKVLKEAGLDGEGQFQAVMRYVKERK